MINRLENVFVECFCLFRLKSITHLDEGVGETLDANTNGAMAHIASVGLFRRIEIDVDDLVEIVGDDFGDFMELFEIIGWRLRAGVYE